MDDVDIITMDTKIQRHFEDENKRLPIYVSKIDDIKKLLEDEQLDDNIINRLNQSIKEYEKLINNIETAQNYNFYTTETISIVESYKKLLKTPVKMNFLGNVPENNIEKRKLIDQFLSIAKKYINIDIVQKDVHKKTIVCENCNSKKTTTDGIFFICCECGYEKEIYINTLSFKDIARTNILQKYTYERRSHFRDCINQFQGKQNCKIDKKVYEDLEDQFEKHHLLIGDKSTPREIRFAKIKKEHIMLFLKELEYDKQYENANYIYSNITGVKCPDITHIEDQLMSDFDILLNLYIKKFKYEKKIDRKSFMNIHYVFFQLLNKNKYPCRKDEFNILKTIDRKAFHDDVFKELFEELGWNHKPFF
jgi:hypothetical protein